MIFIFWFFFFHLIFNFSLLFEIKIPTNYVFVSKYFIIVNLLDFSCDVIDP